MPVEHVYFEHETVDHVAIEQRMKKLTIYLLDCLAMSDIK